MWNYYCMELQWLPIAEEFITFAIDVVAKTSNSSDLLNKDCSYKGKIKPIEKSNKDVCNQAGRPKSD